MCGLWGYSGDQPPDWKKLNDIGVNASRRGPHGWGVAWFDDGSGDSARGLYAYREMKTFRTRDRNPEDIIPGHVKVVVFHARLATSGYGAKLQDAQPISYGEDTKHPVIVAHNGNIDNWRTIAAKYEVALKTDCDSELIAALLHRYGFNPKGITAGFSVVGNIPYVIIALDHTGAMVYAHRKQPLHAERTTDGTYIGQAKWTGSEEVPHDIAHTLNGASEMSTQTRAPDHPISNVRWVDPKTLKSNNYNPNTVFPPEMELLKTSILKTGWTQPVVVDSNNEIIDGFHRWTLASNDEDIRRVSRGLVPIVVGNIEDYQDRMAATVRHNRARGTHGIRAMSKIVQASVASGQSIEEISKAFGMEEEEIARLADFKDTTQRVGQDHFGRSWRPTRDEVVDLDD